MLIEAAANKWQVPVTELSTKDNYVYHSSSQKKASYAELAELAANLTPPSDPKLKDISEYQILGQSLSRFDIPEKVNGSAGFGIDTMLPKMVYATVKAAPVFGEKLLSVDRTKLDAMPGIINVIELENAVAVIATGYWQALQGLKALTIKWTTTATQQVSSQSILSQFSNDISHAIAENDLNKDKEVGEPEKAMSKASKSIEANYQQLMPRFSILI